MKKLTKIWSVGLTLALVCSLLAFAAPEPASAAPGGMAFTTQLVPGGAGDVIQSGSDVTDFAVAADGSTIYLIDQTVDCDTANSVRKSTNGGQSFDRVAGIPTNATSNPPRAIAVAPDDPNAIAVIEANDGTNVVHISTNGGTTWSTLPAFASPSAAADALDIAVGPARAGTLLGREFAVALADSANNTVTAGDVQIIGLTTSWRSAGRNDTIAGDFDYMAVEFDPNFVGSRVLVAVGAARASGGKAPGAGTYLHLINDSTGREVQDRPATRFGATTAVAQDYNRATAAGTDNILLAEIALPMDFDPTTGSGRRSYVVTTHATTTWHHTELTRRKEVRLWPEPGGIPVPKGDTGR